MKTNRVSSKFIKAIVAWASLATSIAVRGDTFDFSYIFSGPAGANGNVSGTLDANLVGDVATGHLNFIHVLSLYVNGHQASGPIFAYDVQNFWAPHGVDGSAIVSFDFTSCRLMFVNDPNYDTDVNPILARFTVDVGGNFGAYASINDGVSGVSLADAGDGTWALTKRTVPEYDATIYLLLCALLGVGALSKTGIWRGLWQR